MKKTRSKGIEQLRLANGTAAIQPKGSARTMPRPPRPELLPAAMRGGAAQAKAERGPGSAWEGAPRPELLPGNGPARVRRVAQLGRVRDPFGFGETMVQKHALALGGRRVAVGMPGGQRGRAGPSPHILQRASQVVWSCTKCGAEETTDSQYRKPGAGRCPQGKKHDWKQGTKSERKEKTISIVESGGSSQRDHQPEHFSEARTWGEAYELLSPWAEFEIESGTLDDVVLFSNVGSIAGALALYREMEGSASWTRGKRLALTAVRSNAHLLQHVGALAATVVTDTTSFVFFGIAANLYKTHTSGPGPWVFDTLTQKGCGGGTCHTEQICLFHLHRYLLTLSNPPESIRLQWYTEKVMCELWCVPTLNLFIELWGSKGTVVESIPSEILVK